MNFSLSPDAYDDLDEIDAWVSEHFGPTFAEKTHARLFDEFELLTEFPQMGRQRPEISSRPIRFFFSSHYWIIYEPNLELGVPLIIHRVVHAARDLYGLGLG